MLFAVAIFVISLAFIATEKGHRTVIALVGATAVMLTQVIDEEEALHAIEWEALGLLAGMMVVVKLTETTGVYTYLAIKTAQAAKGRSFLLVAALAAATAVLSAFLDNLTTILLLVPITFLLADALDIDPIPLVLIEVLACNIGGTATLIGDPPNIMIAAATDLSFMDFLSNTAPIAYLTVAVVTLGLYWFWRERLRVPPESRERVMELDADAAIEDPEELRRLLPVLIGTILAFFVHKPLGFEPATVALSGASVMLLLTRQSIEDTLAGIEWGTLFFFIGLFVMVGALEATGAVGKLADGIVAATGGDRTAELLGISWTAAVVGGVIDNIPMTATMIPVVEQISAGTGDDAYWWALALGACFGGNMTLIAAAPNVAAAAMASRAGRPIGFVQFLKVGVPVTFFSMFMVTGYLLLRYA